MERTDITVAFKSIRLRPWALWCAVVLVASGYLWFVRKNCSPYASNADASGYLNCARVLLSGGPMRTPVPRITGLEPPAWNFYYQEPLGYRVFGDGTYAPMVSVGYPLHLVLASTVVGLDWAAVLVSVVIVAGAGTVTVVLGRQLGLPWIWSFAGVALLWASPLFVYFSLQPMSDVPATFWTAASVAAAWGARKHWGWGLVAGLSIAIAVLVRPTDLLIGIPVAVALGMNWRAWLAVVLSGLPGAGFLVWYNVNLFGAPLATGYGDMGWAFGAKFVPEILMVYAKEMPLLLGPLVVAAALAGLVTVWKSRPVQAAVFAAWIGAFMGFYACCKLTGMAWSMRYVMPAFPPLILTAVWAVHRATTVLKSTSGRWLVPVGLLALSIAWDVGVGRRLNVVIMKRGEVMYVETIRWAQAHLPANAIVVAKQASGAFTFYAQFPLVRYEFAPVEMLERLYDAARANRQEVYAVLFDPESAEAFREKLRGEWTEVGRVKMFGIYQHVDKPQGR